MKYALAVLSVLSGALAQDVDTQLPKCAVRTSPSPSLSSSTTGTRAGKLSRNTVSAANSLDTESILITRLMGDGQTPKVALDHS